MIDIKLTRKKVDKKTQAERAKETKRMRTKYQTQKIKKAMEATRKVTELSEFFLPTGDWLKPNRARIAHASWHRMRDEIQNIEIELAKELEDWPDEPEPLEAGAMERERKGV